jgi:hypothetical protein
MAAKRLPALALLITLMGLFVFPQSLAEIAQKERERRAALKGKKATVITNASLAKLKKKPALETPPAPPATPVEEAVRSDGTPGTTIEPQEPPAALPPDTGNRAPSDLKTLQERYEKAREYVELLTLKMGSLWQQYYNLEDMTTKDAVERSIAETFLKLQTAQEEENLARQALEKSLGQQKREPESSIWVR